MLDVARATYKENVGDVQELRQSLCDEHELRIESFYQERGGGFWFAVKKDDVQGELPRGFLNVTSKGVKWIFTTMELVGATDT